MSKSQQMNLLYMSDNNHQFTTLYSNRFDACKVICGKRNPPKNNTGTGQFQRNPKHTNILQEKCGINYDKPLHPMQVAAARVKRVAAQKKSSSEPGIANVIQPPQQINIANSVPQAGAVQHIGGAIITSGTSIVGKTPIQVNTPGLHQLAAIPLSSVPSSILVNPSFQRKLPQSSLQGNASKLQTAKSTGPQLPYPSTEQLSIQPPSSIQSGSLTFTVQSPVVAFTAAPAASTTARSSVGYPARGAGTKLSAVQHIRQAKQNEQNTSIKQQIKQVSVAQPQQLTIQQPAPTIISGTAGIVEGKKIPVAVTQQHLVLHQHMLKQRQLSHQQQSRQVVGSKPLPQKAIYATVPSPHVVVSGGSTTVKMTPQIRTQMLNQLMQQKQRRTSGKTTVVQPSVTLTVTKLLQSGTSQAVRHSLVQQSSQVAQQSNQHIPSASNIMQSVGMSTQQGIVPQQRPFHMTQIGQSISNQSHVTVTPTIVASTPIVMHRPPVVAIGNPLPQFRVRNPTSSVSPQLSMSASSGQPTINDPSTSSVSVVVSHLPTMEEG